MAIEDGALRLVGTAPAAAAPPSLPLSPIAAELARGSWNAAWWGRGSLASAPATVRSAVALDLAELAVGLRVDGPEQLTAFAAARIAQQPDDQTAGYVGPLVSTGVLGLASAVLVPLYMDKLKIKNRSEWATQFEQLEQTLTAYHAKHGTFPNGDTLPTPSTTCCGGPKYKCAPDAAAWRKPLWQTLGVAFEAPHFFQYRYASDGKQFDVQAIGDLDCDGVAIIFGLHGEVLDGKVIVTQTMPPLNAD